MSGIGIITLILIIANVAFSYKGFTDQLFYNKYKFEVEKILIYKDYKRFITSGFLHVGWLHLIFNMVSLYFFSGVVENYFGAFKFLIIYFASLIGGNILALLIHKNDSGYSSVGASGAVCGVIFASIALFPNNGITLFPIPVSLPAWIYGLLFVAFSIYGVKSRKQNVGHEAHLGGALIGLLIAIIMEPRALVENYITILVIAVPAIAFIYIIITRPHILLVDNLYFKKHKDHYSIDHQYNEKKTNLQKEMDHILDKISSKGMKSLSKEELEKLKKYSQSVR